MLIKNEKQLLNFVKYSPIVVIVSIAILVNILIYVQNKISYERDLKIYERNYIETNKNLIKEQIDTIHKNILEKKSKLDKELKKELLNRVNEAYNIVDNINKKFANEGKQKVLAIIKESLRELRFNNGRGYFYIYDIHGKNIMHPIQPWLEGTNIIGLKDKKGFYFIKDIIENINKKDEYFSTYYWYKPNKTELYKKITVNKKYKPLGLIIGTGNI